MHDFLMIVLIVAGMISISIVLAMLFPSRVTQARDRASIRYFDGRYRRDRK